MRVASRSSLPTVVAAVFCALASLVPVRASGGDLATPSSTATATRTATPTPTVSSASNCCVGHGSGGCDRNSCQTCVCGGDFFCCLVGWDSECVAAAQTTCAADCPCISASVRGAIRYYQGGRPVGSVTVQGSGAATSTSSDGTYLLSDLQPGPFQIVPRKLGDLRDAISSLDAAYAVQSTVGVRTLTDDQRLACDVTGNGTVSSLDAAKIVQMVLGVIPRLPVAESCGSDWAFIPDAQSLPNQEIVPPDVEGGICTDGTIRFQPLAGNLTGQDFRAVLFGDCTGNWGL